MAKGKYIVKTFDSIKDNLNKEYEINEDENLTTHQGHVLITEYTDVYPKTDLKPGIYKLSGDRYEGVKCMPIEYKEKKLVDLESNRVIRKEIEQFVNNFDLYTKRGLNPKRSLLFYSPPGQGKTSTITNTLKNYIDKNTLVLNWVCGNPNESSVFDWMSTQINLKNVSKLFFIIEDLGGTWRDAHVDVTSLLNLLDGSLSIFSVPTMIIATTNHPENLLESICNRPGRFDVVRKMPELSSNDRVKLCKFYAFDMVDVNEEIVGDSKYDKLTICHIEEAVNKAILEKISLEEALDYMLRWDKLFENNFSDKQKVGI